MRMSTAGMSNASISAILDHQVQMAKTQQQLTTGKKFQTASEDPIGATRAAVLDRTLADNAQYDKNSNIIQTRLNYSEQGMADATSILQRVRELALEGANTTLGSTERKMLAGEVRQNAAALLDIANRTDANGEYLYSGTSTNSKPFTQGPTGVNYQGDLTNRQVRISPTQSLPDGHSGADVFLGVASGNGTFATGVTATNTSGATIDVGKVSDPTQWVAGNYTIQFTSPTDWQVVDDATPTPNIISTGTGFTSGQSITFLGATVTIQGTPATNDSFTVKPAQKTDMFAMMENLALTLEGSATTVTDTAQFSHGIGVAIANMDQALERTGTIRADIGSRLSAIDSAAATRQDEAVDLQSLLSDLRDVDYASTISKLSQQYTGLQAAQAAYAKIQQLSLFDYLK